MKNNIDKLLYKHMIVNWLKKSFLFSSLFKISNLQCAIESINQKLALMNIRFSITFDRRHQMGLSTSRE